jgi:hypothetical protein
VIGHIKTCKAPDCWKWALPCFCENKDRIHMHTFCEAHSPGHIDARLEATLLELERMAERKRGKQENIVFNICTHRLLTIRNDSWICCECGEPYDI